ncbi:VCBS repeat-containing protein [Parafrankia sp. EUN1f]|uniref:FG-GAP repeat domain-containing protein n=1 Tax=Parafrankia sp. EUN1f TaxID=102897 RepID=UPI0001C46BFC|nr:VCBS repeat-containing protein [Parafrankia sp. EUN1f]EFC80809.1 hypothetical protein FrEUN1fDRAFT_6059 [Parafrankia sp. EUN1f]
MNSGLEPEELTRLLRAAVEPIRASPDALHQIRAGVERRRWWRMPLMATGGVVMAALIALAFVAVRPQSSSEQVVEPAGPPLVSSMVEPTAGPSAGPSVGGGGSGGGTRPSGGTRPQHTTTPPPTTSSTPRTGTTPSSPVASATTGQGGSGSLSLPSPAHRPALANDVDGDGTADTVRLNGTKVEVVFSRGGKAGSVDLPNLQLPTVHAVVDANGDGFAEVLVRTSSRDNIDEYALLRYAAGGVLSQALPVGGANLRLSAGVRDDSAFGFQCDGSGLRLISGTSSDGISYQTVTTAVQITSDGLVAGQVTQEMVTGSSVGTVFAPGCGTFSALS